MSIANRRLSASIAGAIVAGLAAGACQQPVETPPAPPPEVTVATPAVRKITDWDEYTGRLAAVKSVEVRARVSGYLESVNFRDGQIVDKGALLFIIDPRPYQATLEAARAELASARTRLELAENEFTRAQRLYDSRAVSEEELDRRTQERLAARAARDAAKAKVQSAELEVEFTHVRAPIAGRIGRALVTEGNLVSGGSSAATLLTTIVSLDPIHVYFTADERSALRYIRMDRAGTRPSSRETPNPVRLRLTDEDGFAHEGQMDFVDNRVDQATGTVQGRAIFANPNKLLMPGMFARIQLLGEGPYEALLVPDEALGTDQAQQFVYVLDADDVIQRRLVEPGRLADGLRVIRSGLARDERVVIKGLPLVRHGMKVTPIDGELSSTVDAASRS